MNDQNPSMADHVHADLQEALDTSVGSADITLLRSKMKIELRREFLIQEAGHEAEIFEHEGHHAELAGHLRRVVEGLRTLQPKVVSKAQGDL